ncbi:uncharacterized protein YnzC (UPF0291/DUF896 family) [Scopulibacillus darangshiensis]|uniref:UPF0291 protein EV207_10656 n=1 Tax=Scopulibacillus darangshiensis TaxID=442528 RepID=A0A4R2P5Z0_9BACL|nr:DUF896 domain-containing protein [Scopulibacillus darangshiensis]TCP30233.1 uncharacterized protein YnzC (UPF0291/DUF896 family) [Scopulibacillus darangshiensis]
MLSNEKLQRISELANKSKKESLTSEEKEEQKSLREEYLKAFRGNFKEHLHNVKVVDPKGKDVTPKKLKQSKAKRHLH